MANQITNFLKNGLTQLMPVLGNNFLVWSGNSLEVIYNDEFNDPELGVGGYNPKNDKLVLAVPVNSFPDTTRPAVREVVTFNTREWRIADISKGDVQWILTLVDKERREE